MCVCVCVCEGGNGEYGGRVKPQPFPPMPQPSALPSDASNLNPSLRCLKPQPFPPMPQPSALPSDASNLSPSHLDLLQVCLGPRRKHWPVLPRKVDRVQRTPPSRLWHARCHVLCQPVRPDRVVLLREPQAEVGVGCPVRRPDRDVFLERLDCDVEELKVGVLLDALPPVKVLCGCVRACVCVCV
jgi:hypothetical protein